MSRGIPCDDVMTCYCYSECYCPIKKERNVEKKESKKRKGEVYDAERVDEKVDIIEKIKELSNNIWLLLGPGYTETIYHKALETELRIHNILYESERILPIIYKGFVIGNVRPDIVIVDQLVIELKSVLKLTEDAKLQLMSYCTILQIPGILINFPSRPGELEILEM
jgi:GxxExxY protein